MRKYFIYLMFYSVGGFLLERIINLYYFEGWVDNSVLVGPYQPLYGAGVLMTILVYDFLLKHINNKGIKYVLLLIVAIITTGISEAVTGYGMEHFFDMSLWDYRTYFDYSLQYVGWIPTSLFGFLSFLVVVFVHPFVRTTVSTLPGILRRNIFRILFVIFIVDIIYTFFNRI